MSNISASRRPRCLSMNIKIRKISSIVLMAVVDKDYQFICLESGSSGSCSDAQILTVNLRSEDGICLVFQRDDHFYEQVYFIFLSRSCTCLEE